MTEREEIEFLKKQIEELRNQASDDRLAFLNTRLDIGALRDAIRDTKESISRVSAFSGERFVEFRERLTGLETRFFKTLGEDFTEVEKIIGKADDPGPPKTT
jgi:hypothetical protein